MRLLLLSIICFLSVACKTDTGAAKKFGDPEDVGLEVSTNVRLIHSEKGATDAIITAPVMHRYSSSEHKIIFPEGLQIETFEEGEGTAMIRAGYGERNESNFMFSMNQGVVMLNQKEEKMESENLLWNEKKATITIDGKVKVTTPTDIIEGYGLVADDKFQNYSLGKVSGVVHVEDDNVP